MHSTAQQLFVDATRQVGVERLRDLGPGIIRAGLPPQEDTEQHPPATKTTAGIR